jgi:hypothetical protein
MLREIINDVVDVKMKQSTLPLGRCRPLRGPVPPAAEGISTRSAQEPLRLLAFWCSTQGVSLIWDPQALLPRWVRRVPLTPTGIRVLALDRRSSPWRKSAVDWNPLHQKTPASVELF